RDVVLGAVGTAALFEIGKVAIGLYIGKQGLESTYGASASIVVVLIWVYYSARAAPDACQFTETCVSWERSVSSPSQAQTHHTTMPSMVTTMAMVPRMSSVPGA